MSPPQQRLHSSHRRIFLHSDTSLPWHVTCSVVEYLLTLTCSGCPGVLLAHMLARLRSRQDVHWVRCHENPGPWFNLAPSHIGPLGGIAAMQLCGRLGRRGNTIFRHNAMRFMENPCTQAHEPMNGYRLANQHKHYVSQVDGMQLRLGCGWNHYRIYQQKI